MSDSSVLNPEAPASDLSSVQLPISSIVRAVCEAANGGPDLLYEVTRMRVGAWIYFSVARIVGERVR